MRLRFGEFLFDSVAHELRRDAQGVDLAPKTLRFLEVLLERRPAALSKPELLELLWPRTFVTEGSLARLAAELRAALGDDAKVPRFVRTVYGFGYAFSGETREAPLPSSAPGSTGLRLEVGSRDVPLDEGENILGRTEDARVWINSPRASRRHARIVVENGQATLEDLSSKNGTFLRGMRINGVERLDDGDEIVIGPILMTFRTGPSGSTETDAIA
jgi:DNA-binding winged helix-turn-helix (wHTH) protein